MHKYRKFFAMLLVVCMVFGSTELALAAEAHEKEVFISNLTAVDFAQESAIVSKQASSLSSEIVAVLSEGDVRIEPETLVEVLPINESNDRAICVTNFSADNAVIEREVMVPTIEDENGAYVIDNTLAAMIAGEPVERDVERNYGTGVTLYVTAYENVFVTSMETYYQPYKVAYRYVKSASVNRVDSYKVHTRTTGFLHNESDFSEVDPDSAPYYMNVPSTIPTGNAYVGNNVTVEKTNYYLLNNDYVMQIVSGWIEMDHSIVVAITIDGVAYDYVIDLDSGL